MGGNKLYPLDRIPKPLPFVSYKLFLCFRLHVQFYTHPLLIVNMVKKTWQLLSVTINVWYNCCICIYIIHIGYYYYIIIIIIIIIIAVVAIIIITVFLIKLEFLWLINFSYFDMGSRISNWNVEIGNCVNFKLENLVPTFCFAKFLKSVPILQSLSWKSVKTDFFNISIRA